MKKKAAAVKVKTSVSYRKCELFCSEPMRCPLCGVLVPAMTPHTCEKSC